MIQHFFKKKPTPEPFGYEDRRQSELRLKMIHFFFYIIAFTTIFGLFLSATLVGWVLLKLIHVL